MNEVARLEAALPHVTVPGLYLSEPSLPNSGWVSTVQARLFLVAALIDAAGLDPALAVRIRPEMLAAAQALVETLRGESVPTGTSGANVLRFSRTR